MLNNFKTVDPKKINDNLLSLVGDYWMLITAGNLESFNTMTASWGGFGIIWHRPVIFCFIRPQRYTYEFMENYDIFSLCFFTWEFRDILDFCGTHSGRHVNKVKSTGLIPLETDNKSIVFKQSRLIIECRKIYFNDLDPGNFLDPRILNEYPRKDYHRMYIGEILNCLEKNNETVL